MNYEIFNEDCLEGMKRIETEQKFFDVAQKRIDEALAKKAQELF